MCQICQDYKSDLPHTYQHWTFHRHSCSACHEQGQKCHWVACHTLDRLSSHYRNYHFSL